MGTSKRSARDAALLGALQQAANALVFTAGMSMRRARHVSALADALRACDVDNLKQLGRLLGRCEGQRVADTRLVRGRVKRAGTLWQFVSA